MDTETPKPIPPAPKIRRHIWRTTSKYAFQLHKGYYRLLKDGKPWTGFRL
jgi:hypothetical protein